MEIFELYMNAEKCSSCYKGNLIEEYDEGGNHIKKFSCGHRNVGVSLHENMSISDSVEVRKGVVRIMNESVTVSDNVNVGLGLYFELTDPISVSGIKKNSNDVELVFDKQNLSMLVGFRIKINNFQDEKQILKVFQQAYKLTNLLTLKTGMYVFHKRARKIENGQVTGTLSFTVSAILTKLVNLDMNDSNLNEILNDDSRENQQLAHFSNGMRAFQDGNFVDPIKEFYQVIEYEKIQHLEKYTSLRHGVSHAELCDGPTIQEIKNFGITCKINQNSKLNPKGQYVDITDPDVLDILKKESTYLKNEVIKFLDSKIKVKTN